MASEMAACLDQVFLVHVGNHIHDDGLRGVIATVDLTLEDIPVVVVQMIPIRRDWMPHFAVTFS